MKRDKQDYTVGDTIIFEDKPCLVLRIARYREIKEECSILISNHSTVDDIFYRLLIGNEKQWVEEGCFDDRCAVIFKVHLIQLWGASTPLKTNIG